MPRRRPGALRAFQWPQCESSLARPSCEVAAPRAILVDQRAEAAKTTERGRAYRHDSAAEEIAGLELGGLGWRTEVDVGSKLLGSRGHLNHKPIASADSRQDADGRTAARASAHRCRGELRAIRRPAGTPHVLKIGREHV